jgi:hypothetical protein
VTPAPPTATTSTTTSSPTGASTTSPPPVGPGDLQELDPVVVVTLGPVQQSLLFFLLMALLRRLGILPPLDDDTQDARYLLSSGSTDAALRQLRQQIGQTRPEALPQFDRLLLELQTTGPVVVV